MANGFKVWAVGDRVTAADMNDYVQEQTVGIFADATARDAQITGPIEGQAAYLKDSNSITVYSGSAWVTIADLEVLNVDSANGRVGIGVNDPAGKLTLNHDNADGVVDFADGLLFTNNAGGGATEWTHAGIVSTGSSGFNGNLVFGTDGDSTQNTSGIAERMRITSDGDVQLSGSSNDFEVTTDGSNFYGLGKYYQANSSVNLSATTGFYTITSVVVPKGRWLVIGTGRMEYAIASAGRYFNWRIANVSQGTFVNDYPAMTTHHTALYDPIAVAAVVETTGNQTLGFQVAQSVAGTTVLALGYIQAIGVH